jgi:hypothetical protein
MRVHETLYLGLILRYCQSVWTTGLDVTCSTVSAFFKSFDVPCISNFIQEFVVWGDISGVHFTFGTSCERAGPLAEKNAAARHHVLRRLISMLNERRVYIYIYTNTHNRARFLRARLAVLSCSVFLEVETWSAPTDIQLLPFHKFSGMFATLRKRCIHTRMCTYAWDLYSGGDRDTEYSEAFFDLVYRVKSS